MEESTTRLKKKAKVSESLKQKAQENKRMSLNEIESDNFVNESVGEVEAYFIEKILIYLEDFDEERTYHKKQIEKLEIELEESKNSQINLLIKLKDSNMELKCQEAKINFYRNQIKRYENKN